MKNLTKTVVLVLAIAVVLTGCKQPTQLINDVKAAIETVTTAGADKYAPEELRAVNDDLTKALDRNRRSGQEVLQEIRVRRRKC